MRSDRRASQTERPQARVCGSCGCVVPTAMWFLRRAREVPCVPKTSLSRRKRFCGSYGGQGGRAGDEQALDIEAEGRRDVVTCVFPKGLDGGGSYGGHGGRAGDEQALDVEAEGRRDVVLHCRSRLHERARDDGLELRQRGLLGTAGRNNRMAVVVRDRVGFGFGFGFGFGCGGARPWGRALLSSCLAQWLPRAFAPKSVRHRDNTPQGNRVVSCPSRSPPPSRS